MFEAFEPRIVLATTHIDINPSGDSLVQPPDQVLFMPIGDITFFVADDGSTGKELWVTDGTVAGTSQVKDINPGAASSNPGVFYEFQGELYFVANDGANGEELWKSDGTAAGTMMLSDIHPGSGYQYPYGNGPLQSFPRDFTELNGMLLFSAENATNGAELWRTDGTAAGTMMVADIFPGTFDDDFGTYPNSSNPTGLVQFNGAVYFAADNGTSGRELWKTDGTEAGTVLVKDIYTGEYEYVRNGTNFGLYPSSSNPVQLTVSGDSLFFVARDSLLLGETSSLDQSNFELWKTDGTAAGTEIVLDINPGDAGSLVIDSDLFDVNGLLVFVADDGFGESLWRSNGLESGTLKLRDFSSGVGNLSDYAFFTVNDGVLYFAADDGDSGRELWRTNGTFLGTRIVRDISPGITDGFPLFIESVDGVLYFAAIDVATGLELWRSDGTEAGTMLVEDIVPGTEGSSPSAFSKAGSTLIFAADDGTAGRELWFFTEDARDANASITVYVNSEPVNIPANIGVESNGDTALVFTNATGDLAFNTADNVTLGDFFDVWRTDAGQVTNNTSATFGSMELLGNVSDGDHSVQMFVNGELQTSFDDYVLRPNDDVILVYGSNPVVSFLTNFGPIVMELFESDTPITVDNFLDYINDGSYLNSFFHRSDPGFVIQGGGFRTTTPALIDLDQLTPIPTNDPIQNEPGISNQLGTIAMAKLGNAPNSATNQFFVNLGDNSSFLDTDNGGFTVFGQVLDMATVDFIASLSVIDVDGGLYAELPLSDDDEVTTVIALEGNGYVSGRQYADGNGNGVYDSGEESVGSVVFIDANSNGALDAGEMRAITDATGRFLLQAEPGTYSIRAASNSISVNAHTVAIEIGRTVSNIDFVDGALSAPTSIDLAAASDLGASDADDFTSLNNSSATDVLQFFVTGVFDGAEVRIYSDGLIVGSGMAFGDTVTVATDGTSTISNGTHAFAATVISSGRAESSPSPAINVEIAKIGLAAFTTDPPTTATAGEAFSFDVNAGDEGRVTYSLMGAPTGMTIHSTSGVISWTPTTAQTTAPVAVDIIASDAAGNAISQAATITVLGDISASPDTYSTPEDTALIVGAGQGVLSNDGSGSEALTAMVVTAPTNGTLTLNADGSFSYVPNANFSGQDTFTYSASTTLDTSNVALVTITVDPINDAPVGNVDNYSTPEHTVLSIVAANGVLKNDTDADGDNLTAVVASQPTHGLLVLLANGSITYTPNANFVGDDTFTYTVSDGVATSAPVTVTIEVVEINDVPVTISDSYSLAEDGSITVSVANGVLANDSDDGTTLTATVSTQPSHGAVGLNSDGSFTYTPTANFFGVDTFGYKASDGTLDSIETFVTIMVTGVPDAPNANDDALTATANGTPQVLNVLANDTDPDGVPSLTITSVTQGSQGGTVTFSGTSLSYTATAGFAGADTFTYTVTDTDGLTDTATVVVTVTGSGNSVVSGFVFIDRNNDGVRDAGEVGIPGSLVTLVSANSSVNRTALTTDTGFYTFDTVAAGTYQLKQSQPAATLDGIASANMANAVIAVNEIGNIVVTSGQALIENNFGEQSLRPEFMSIAWFFASSASNGTQAQVLRSVIAAAEERMGNNDLAQSIRAGSTEGPVNTAPVATTDSFTVKENGVLNVTASTGVLKNDTDANGDSLSVTLGDTTTHGTLSLSPNGSFTYTPQTDYVGIDSFTYSASDGEATSNTALVTIIVDADAPTQTGDNRFSITENTPAGTVIGSVTPSAALGSQRIYEIVDSTVPPELALKVEDHLAGDADAQIVLIEYLDLQCPICEQFHPIIESLKNEFDNELLVVSRHLPLESVHLNARSAARSAEAAARQGRFAEMVDLMFENQADWEFASNPQSFFDTYAAGLGLNMTQFASDRVDAAIDARIQRDLDDAATLGANATPTFYLDGRFVSNSVALSDFSGLIDDELDDFDAPFIVDRLSGQIIVAPGTSFNALSTPVRTFNVRVTDAAGLTSTESVVVNVTNASQAPLSASAIVDAAFADYDGN